MRIKRSVGAASLMAAAGMWASVANAQVIGLGDRSVRLTDFHSFQTDGSEIAPTDMVQMPDGRFLVATLGGSVRLLNSSGGFISTLLSPAETQTTKVDVTHYGMTSLALHPQFATQGSFGYGKVYALVTQQPQSQTGIAADFTVPGSNPSMAFTNQDVVREYDLSGMLDNGVVSFVGQPPNSRDIWRIDSPQASHNAFDIAFRDNGDLFISSGDGGFTELTGDFSYYNRRQGAQDLNVAYGKILRINPDPTAYSMRGGQNNQYSIPDDNPFIDTPDSLDEIYANGVRSPYRMNLDPNDATQETLWVGDVGAGSREEVSRVTKGSNLGWGRFEGATQITNSITLAGASPTPPEFQYAHSPRSLQFSGGGISTYNAASGGNSITGGHIYRGSLLGADFRGMYVGANLGHHSGNATWLPRLFYGDPDSSALDVSSFQYAEDSLLFDDSFLDAENFATGFDFAAAGLTPGKFWLPQLVLSIAEDNAGELYVLGVDFNGLGTISKVLPTATPGDVNGDQLVDIADFRIIRDHLGLEVDSRSMGDLTGNQRVDLNDFQRWFDNASPAALATLKKLQHAPELSALTYAILAASIGWLTPAVGRRRQPA